MTFTNIVKVKVTLERPKKAQREDGDIALPTHNRDARKRWMVRITEIKKLLELHKRGLVKIGNLKKTQKVLVEIPEEKKPLARPKHIL